MIPQAYKVGLLGSQFPLSGAGDFTVVRNGTKTRINAQGVVSSVAAHIPAFDYIGGCPELSVEGQATQLYEHTAVMASQTKTVTAVAHTVSFWGTGQISFTGAFTGSLQGTGVTNRVQLTFTPTAGALVSTVLGDVRLSQLEAGSRATSYIPNTTTGMITRIADVISNTAILAALQPCTVLENNNAFVVPRYPTNEINLNPLSIRRFEVYDSLTDLEISGLGAVRRDCIWASRLIANGIFVINVTGTGVIHWGDGATSSYNGTSINVSHNYSMFNGIIYITGTLTRVVSNTSDLRHNIASLPAGMTFYENIGSNTTSGSIASLPAGLTFYSNYGSNTTSGSINGLPAGLVSYWNVGLNQVNHYSAGRVWANVMRRFSHHPASGFGLTTAMVDALLIDLSVPTWGTGGIIDLRGNNSPRSAASNAAVTLLLSKGVNVTTN